MGLDYTRDYLLIMNRFVRILCAGNFAQRAVDMIDGVDLLA